MPWAQVYDPLGHPALSTCSRRASGRRSPGSARVLSGARARGGAAVARGGPLRRPRSVRHAGVGGSRRHRLRCGLRAVPDRLDRPQPHLPVRPERVARPLRGPPHEPRPAVSRPSGPGDRDRLLPGGILRGRGRLRHARGRDRGAPDPARLHAARGLEPVADREHGAGGVRRAGDADHRSAGGDGTRPARAVGDGGAAASGVRAHRAVLGRGGPRGAARDVGRLAGGPRRRRGLRRAPVRHLQLPRPLARGRRLRHRLDGRARDPAPLLAATRPVGTHRRPGRSARPGFRLPPHAAPRSGKPGGRGCC